MSNGSPHIRHLHKDSLFLSSQAPNSRIPFDFREFSVAAVDDVLSLELGTILVESVRHEYRDIIEPIITRRGTKQDPPVFLRDLKEYRRPFTAAHETLFIKDEESPLDIPVFSNVLP